MGIGFLDATTVLQSVLETAEANGDKKANDVNDPDLVELLALDMKIFAHILQDHLYAGQGMNGLFAILIAVGNAKNNN